MKTNQRRTYYTAQSNFREEIKFDFRENCNLVIFTSFNPMREFCFTDQIEADANVDRITSMHRYDDNTGAITVKLVEGYDHDKVVEAVRKAFYDNYGLSAHFIPIFEK